MNDSYYAFVNKERSGRDTIVKLPAGSSWMEICDALVGYLQACGFSIDGADVAEYFQEVYGDLMEAKNE